MIYCDTSLLVSALLSTEPASEAAAAWLGEQHAGDLALSAWVHTEFASAVAMKVRRGALDEPARMRVLQTWSALHDSFRWLAVKREHFDHAADLLSERDVPLRSGDALHLAIAFHHGCTMATLDRDLFRAAEQLGISAGSLIR